MARSNARAASSSNRSAQNRATRRNNALLRQDPAIPPPPATRGRGRNQSGRGRGRHDIPNSTPTATPDAPVKRKKNGWALKVGPKGLDGPNGGAPTLEIRRSHIALRQFLQNYQVPAEYAARPVTIDMLRHVAYFITLFQVRRNPRTDKPVQKWTEEHITSILHRVFEGRMPGEDDDNDRSNDDFRWRVDHLPEPYDLPSPESCKRFAGAFVTDREREDYDCCNRGKTAVMKLGFARSTFTFIYSCDREHVAHEGNIAFDPRGDFQHMREGLQRRWNDDEMKYTYDYNTRRLIYNIRYIFFKEGAPDPARDARYEYGSPKRIPPSNLDEMCAAMHEPVLCSIVPRPIEELDLT